MKWLMDFMRLYPLHAIIPSVGLGVFAFLGNLFLALSDGNLDGNEVHSLLSSASGIESAILIAVMIAFKKR